MKRSHQKGCGLTGRTVRRFTDSERATFECEWEKGTALKIIATKMDPVPTLKQLKNLRRNMGLDPRSTQSVLKHQLKISISNADWKAIRLRAKLRGSTISSYVRYLIRREL